MENDSKNGAIFFDYDSPVLYYRTCFGCKKRNKSGFILDYTRGILDIDILEFHVLC